MAVSSLFESELKAINIGLESFKTSLDDKGVKTVQVEFKPPLSQDLSLLKKIKANASAIAAANKKALARILNSKPALVGLNRAINVVPGMKKDLLLHAGPPVKWAEMCGPMRGAVMGALMYEGLAPDEKAAEKLAASGKIKFSPCHEHSAVGPMAGVISASMPVFIVKNEEYGNYAYATMNEGLGKVLRYGAYSPEVIERLKWMETVMYPALKRAVERLGRVDLKSITAQALHMGDEVHNRNRAGTSLFYRTIAPAVIRTTADTEQAAAVLEFINKNDHSFLNLSMALSKACLDAARDIRYSTVVVVMARNGTEFGVQLAGTGNMWFTGPAPVPDALFFAGYTKADANPDIGDSAITETNGLGGFAIAAAPAIVQFVGGKAADAVNYTMAMYEITAGENNVYQIPYLDFRGTPTGIDVVKVVESGVLPFIDTGVAHKKPGIGQVGAGVLSAPPEPFVKAFEYFARGL
ncbi:MAG: hypothetical protein A2270_10145 [Elusimicrobia bacterium RIFOXYA12_FULL_51_18]|nr:MAG: hypothetical protein A2270_10145 [Elusimicrobia bacterium RIFOXYA12_FULL_51_18]OGS29574.1 MAG: hypothetical protein A2218_01045 [Elusimicrobia bacterium RIFOXYA2_FULL_53_38]